MRKCTHETTREGITIVKEHYEDGRWAVVARFYGRGMAYDDGSHDAKIFVAVLENLEKNIAKAMSKAAP